MLPTLFFIIITIIGMKTEKDYGKMAKFQELMKNFLLSAFLNIMEI
jgi:hypothetical protein